MSTAELLLPTDCCPLPAVVEIAAQMPAHLRSQRGIMLVREPGGRGLGDSLCPGCEAHPIVGHEGLVPVLCPLCRGFGTVSGGVREWFLGVAGNVEQGVQDGPGVQHILARCEMRAHEHARNWGRMAESGGAGAVTIPAIVD